MEFLNYDDNPQEINNEYVVEKIISKKISRKKNKIYYLVKWENNPYGEISWEPEENLIYLKELIYQYEEEKTEVNKNKNNKNDLQINFQNNFQNNKNQTPNKNLNTYSNATTTNRNYQSNTPSHKKKKKYTCNNQNSLQRQFLPPEGNLSTDKPNKIEKIIYNKGNSFSLIVSWNPRISGIIPSNSEVSYEEFSSNYPYLLIHFYEKHFINTSTDI
jgi:hypothetical protein